MGWSHVSAGGRSGASGVTGVRRGRCYRASRGRAGSRGAARFFVNECADDVVDLEHTLR